MALVLVKETGEGIVGANSYANLTDALSYAESHVDGQAWIDAANKERALVMATRILDYAMEWKGSRVAAGQALAWPRDGFELDGLLYDSNPIPRGLVEATCELARILVANGDVTKPNDKDDVKSFTIGPIKFDFRDKGLSTNAEKAGNILPASVLMMLDGFGLVEEQGGGAVRLVRY